VTGVQTCALPILRDLSDFSRPSSADISEIKINDVINDAVGLLKHDARFRHIIFKLLLKDNLPIINVNKDQLYQVMVNLLINAADAMENALDPQIIIETKVEKKSVSIRVEDKGKGISSDLHNKIFDPFFTTKPVGSGTGLGLSVSHGIISKMGGTIKVDPTPEIGATFIIILPIYRKDA